ncbi:MAG: GntR family transcriptional regulator [Geminicoccaceae bacterium]|jgi:DNA-binding GntR family transcriptional regulator|nr:GntR family transcriptional regulator [Geminicoccaceae bacterium]MCB9967999.1 GntR family transcriptional regulator [Geminicoccaceae bacterium]HRY26657.1 GntR family transcriptional regulator [Geminicoccaceae bacterium]
MTTRQLPDESGPGPFPVQRLQRATLNDEVYHELRRAIMSGAIEPGSTMTIRGLAQSFGISLMPVRQALNRLVAEHVLVLLPNRSVALPRIDAARFREITRIRVALEGLAAEEAVAHVDADAIARMAAANVAIEAGAAPGEALALNREFHFTLYAASAMPTLVAMIETTWLQVGPLLHVPIRRMMDGAAPRSLPAHRRVLAGLRAGDAAEVRDAIRADLEDAAVDIAATLD